MSDDRTQIASRGSAINIGTELNQTYCIDELLGVGGMGEVFKGHNIQTGDPVAIKIVLPEFAKDEMILELFRKEARILNHLSHDAIVRYYVFSIERSIGRPYLAMEYVDGQSLAEHVRKQPLKAEDGIELLRRLADGLHKAHDAGVIHRDMSPDNVILPGGAVSKAKIIDFGIARSANVGGATLLGGSFAGKYNYVSPEQLGLFGGEVTARSDIYSLALVMAAALRGRPLQMSGSQVEVIEKRRVVPDLSDIPKRLQGILTAMLQPDPANRPISMADVRDWNFGETRGAAKSPAKSSEQKATGTGAKSELPGAAPSNALRNAIIGLGAVAVMAVGALGGWIYVTGQNPAPESANQGTQANTDTQQAANTDTQQAANTEAQQAAKTEEQQAASTETPNADATAQQQAASQPSATTDNQGAATNTGTAKAETSQPPSSETPTTSESSVASPQEQTVAAQQREVTAEGPVDQGQPQTQTSVANPGTDQQANGVPQSGNAGTVTDVGSGTTAESVGQGSAQTDVGSSTTAQEAEQGSAQTSVTQQQAALSTNEGTEPTVTVENNDAQLTSFVRSFGSGKCFVPGFIGIAGRTADVSVIASLDEAAAFKTAFNTKAGFEPKLEINQPSPEQCQVLSELGKLPESIDKPISIALEKQDIQPNNEVTKTAGDGLNFVASGIGQRSAYVFFITDAGQAFNIKRLRPNDVKQQKDELMVRTSITSDVPPDDALAFRPVLVLVIASPRPLLATEAQDAFEPEDFVAALKSDLTDATDVSRQLSYVRLLK